MLFLAVQLMQIKLRAEDYINAKANFEKTLLAKAEFEIAKNCSRV